MIAKQFEKDKNCTQSNGNLGTSPMVLCFFQNCNAAELQLIRSTTSAKESITCIISKNGKLFEHRPDIRLATVLSKDCNRRKITRKVV